MSMSKSWQRRRDAARKTRRTAYHPFLELLENRTLLSNNAIVTENLLPGNAASQWDISGSGDASLQGFATDISVDHGQTINFKINDTAAVPYHIDIYRMGYYGGMGARLEASISASCIEPQVV